MPIPKNRKIIIRLYTLDDIAYPTAVPKKGALHGVANNVANAPSKKAVPFSLYLKYLSIPV